ncbi:MAG: hypothetical protein IKP35_01775 [Alphaproteobacteria bacterium]|nr:hypothetical protein [Alphaproteobacteria bacterium]MBR6010131.1 hypothetical protein [Alphaproteobacteria bacterium]
MKKVTVNVNTEKFSAICDKQKTDHCPVSVFSRELCKYAPVSVNTKRTETEKRVNLTCKEQSTKDLFMAVRAICDTCVHRSVNQITK